MQLINFRVPKTWELVMWGDTHEGNALQYSKGIRQTIDYVLDKPNRCCIHMGDAVEAVYYKDKRFTPKTIVKEPTEAMQDVIKQYSALTKGRQLITVLLGNHEAELSGAAGNFARMMCTGLNVPYGGFTCVVNFIGSDGKLQFKGFFEHGKRLIRTIADDPIRRMSNEQLQLKQHLKLKMGDCVLMAKGHTHKLIVAPPHETLYLETMGTEIKEHYNQTAYSEGPYIHPDHRWYVNTGSYLKTFGMNIESYSEMAEYDPIEIGYAVASIEDGKLVDIRRVVL